MAHSGKLPPAVRVPPARAQGFRRFGALRVLGQAAASLLLLLVCAAAALYILCLVNPDLVASEAQRMLSAASGLPFRIRGGVRPVLLPAPGLEASDVLIAAPGNGPGAQDGGDKPLARARTLGVYLDPSSLLHGKLGIGRVEFYKPVVNLSFDGASGRLRLPGPAGYAENTANENTAQGSAARDDGAGASVGRDGGPGKNAAPADRAGEDTGREARLKTLRHVAELLCAPPGEGMPPVAVREGRFFMYTGRGDLLFSLREVNGGFAPEAEGENFHVSAAFALPDAGLSLRFSLAAGIGRPASPAQGRISGALDMLPPGSRTITAEFSSGFALDADGSVLHLPEFSLNSEGDALRADLRVDLAAPECTGKVTLDRLSLTRWFGFGRVLPPGLREALHSMRGEFDLFLSSDRVEAGNLRAEAGGLRLQGNVGTPDFSAPVVVVQAALLGKLDADRLFPFLGVAGRSLPVPQPPVFDHPPLAPYPDDPAAPPSQAGEGISVGYDINVHADEILLHGVEGGPLDIRVHPAPDGSDRTRVDIRAANLLRGRAEGYIDVDAAGLRMHYAVAGAELGLLPENGAGSTRIAGSATGICEIDMPMAQDGSIADDWPLRADVQVKNMRISGRFRGREWFLDCGNAAAKGAGSIYAVPERGVVIGGEWNLGAQTLRTSRHPVGDDALKGTFAGTVIWPPMPARDAAGVELKTQRYSVERVEGKSVLSGVMTLPSASHALPVKGKITADFVWNVHAETLHIRKAAFEGMDSYAETTATLDFSGPETTVQAAPSFKLSLRELLAAWKITMPEAVHAPKVLSGRAELFSGADGVRLEKIRAEIDSSPLSGEIAVRGAPFAAAGGPAAGDPGLREMWTVRLKSEQLDLDSFFPDRHTSGTPPDHRSGQVAAAPVRPANARTVAGRERAAEDKRPDLSFVKGLAVDARIQAKRLRKSKMTAEDAVFTAVLNNSAFSLRFTTDKFYGGVCDLDLQGTVQPDSAIRLQRGGLRLRGVALEGVLGDYTGEQSCAGTTDLDAELHGVFTRGSDYPAGLSGSWKLNIKDGMYPAFFSGPDSRLRNTFSLASASGPLDRGVIRSDNFKLGGPMVDMAGGGWYDLNTRDLDIRVSVTFAKVPTLPVQFYGNIDSPRMNIRGVDMVMETMQAAGSGLFGLIRGVLELPAKAVTGIGSLFEGSGAPARQAPRRQKPEAGKTSSDKIPVRGSTMPVRR
ncbi:MAG: AsmA family protein [Desulfovibrio sp.]|jgi:AsmA protein|nr:AsmA family protein [Desulfovibrio sp.]